MPNAKSQIFTCQDGLEVPIAWQTSSRNRNIRLTVATSGVRISSPPRTKWSVIEKFLSTQEAWLKVQLQKQVPVSPNRLLYQGNKFKIKISPTAQPTRVHFRDDVCYISPIRPADESVQQTLERWLKTAAADELTPVFLDCRQAMGVQASNLRWRDTKSRWGSCSTDGQIMLSWRLIHAPPAVARYVIIHELAHRIHHNHSSHFWKLVAEHDPAYKVHRGWLKRHGHQCQTPQTKLY